MKRFLLIAAAASMGMAASAQTVIAPPSVEEAQAAGMEALWGDYQYGYVLPQDYTLVDNDAIKVVMNNGSSAKPGANVSVSGLNTTVFSAAFNMGSSAEFGTNDAVYDLAAVSNGIKQPYAIFTVEPKIGGELTMYTNRSNKKYTIYVWDTTAKKFGEGEDITYDGSYVLTNSVEPGDSYGKELVSQSTVGLLAGHTYWIFASEVGANTFMYEMVYTPYSSENYSVTEFDASKFENIIAPPTVEEAQAAGMEALWGDYQYGYVLPQDYTLVNDDVIKVVMNNGSSSKPGANISVSGLNTTAFSAAFNMGSSAVFGANDAVYDLAAVSNGIKQPYAIFTVEPKIGGELTMYTNRSNKKYTIYVWDTTAKKFGEGEDITYDGSYVFANSVETGDSYGKELVSKATVGLLAGHTYWIFASEVGANTFMYAMGYNSYASPNYSYQGNGGTTGIADMIVDAKAENNVIYNVMGQVVDSNYKGLVIKNGKKYIQK